MKFGLMQGRLMQPEEGHIQEFPSSWEEEFKVLEECDLLGVEWLITSKTRYENPIFKDPKLVNSYPILSVCVDTLVDERIVEKDFLHDNLDRLCKVLANEPGVNNITIPLLEESSMCEEKTRGKFRDLIQEYGDKYPGLNFSFEAELEIQALSDIVSLCNNFYVTYDTGNITSFGINHKEYINHFSGKINNVHLKDRTFDANTVAPLTGDTDFETIFSSLADINYNGSYILQTARGKTGDEKKTILTHKKIFQELHDRHF
tara:strand:+ start:78 stop:857 length:780 start_codon:yes stop_codon:yes gene_type:complete